jgi:hypothetical protein
MSTAAGVKTYEAALDKERRRYLAWLLLWNVRIWLVASLAGPVVALINSSWEPMKLVFPVLGAGLVVAVGNWLAARRWPALLGMPTMTLIPNLMTMTAVDATAIARASSRDQTVFFIVMHNGLNMVFMSLVQFAVPRRRELLLLALLLSVIESGFLIWGGLSSTIPLLMMHFSFGLMPANRQ